MKNQSNKYWENRANTRMASYHKKSDKAINIITNAYDKAIADISEEVRKIHDKFVLEGDLTPGEARQLLNSKISKDELEDLKLKISHIQDEDLKKYLMSRLNSPAYKARMTRLEALKENIYIECKKAYEVELEVSKAAYIDTINNAYYKSIFDVQKGLDVGFSFAQIPTKTIESILNDPWSGKHFSKRIWNNTDVLAEHLNKIVTSSFMSGKGTKKMAMELAEITNVSKFAAERLIRTETTYMANAAEMESYKECEIEKYMFLATLDLRTSEVCREHDSKTYEVDKAIPGENLPPLHPHCRSTTVAHFEDDTLKGIERRARDPEIGKSYTIPADTNYNYWYKKHVIDRYGQEKVHIMEKKIKNETSDKKQYEKFKEILGKDMPKSLENFQELKYNNSEEWNRIKSSFESQFVKKDFSKIPLFHQTCSNLLTRKWYKWHDENIPNLIDRIKPIEEQAKQAHNLRNTYRTQARDLMKDQEERRNLDIEHPNKTFEELINDKMNRKKISREQAIADTLKTATVTNKEVNKSLGLE